MLANLQLEKLNPAGQSLFFVQCWNVCFNLRLGRTPSESNSSSNFRRFDDESQEWLNIWMYIFQRRCFQRDEWYVEKLFISHFSGSPDTYLYDRKYVLSYVWSAGSKILLYDQWYLCVIYLHHSYPGAHVKIYSIPLWYLICSWQSI